MSRNILQSSALGGSQYPAQNWNQQTFAPNFQQSQNIGGGNSNVYNNYHSNNGGGFDSNRQEVSNVHTMVTRMSDDESDEDDQYNEELNLKKIAYNSVIIEAYNAFSRRDLKQSADFYLRALFEAESTKNADRIALIKANLAVIYFHSCQYKLAEKQLVEAADLLKQPSQQKPEHRAALQVKVFANLAIVSITLNKFEEAMAANEDAISIILQGGNESQRKDLLEELVYLYFRFLSFESMGNGMFENLELKYDEPTLACFYSSMALNRELCGDNQGATMYHEKALQMWDSLNDPGFCVLTLKHLITLNGGFSESNVVQQYQARMNDLLKHPDFKGVNPDTLFKQFEEKIKCGKQITQNVKRIEMQSGKLMQSQIMKSGNRSQFNLNEYGEPMWKQALRLRLTTSVNYSKSILKDTNLDKAQKEALQLGIEQMYKTISMLKTEKHPLVEKQLMAMPFTKEAINNLTRAVSRLKKIILTVSYLDAFDRLQDFMIDKSRQSLALRQQKRVDTLIHSSYKYAMVGDYLLKCNKTTNGRLQKFFQLSDQKLVWTSRENNIKKVDKTQFYFMQDVKGILYGKHTEVFEKPFNKKLEPWLCFSLVLKSRTLDLYCEPDQINRWLFALSEETKRRNSGAFVPKPSQVLWRKMKMILYYHFVEPYLAQNPTKRIRHSFVKAIISFGRSGSKLPVKTAPAASGKSKK